MVRWLLLVVLSLAALGVQVASAEDGRRYYEEYGFSVIIPDGWEVRDDYLGSVFAALSPLETPPAKFRTNINVVCEMVGYALTLEDFLAEAEPVMAETFTGYAALDRGELEIDGESAAWMAFTHRVGQIPLATVIYAVITDGCLYLLTGMTASGRLDEFRPLFAETAGSIRFIPAGEESLEAAGNEIGAVIDQKG